jgi:hypothetical protein
MTMSKITKFCQCKEFQGLRLVGQLSFVTITLDTLVCVFSNDLFF